MISHRRKTLIAKRGIPCECCGYPLSQQHHLLPFSLYGETAAVLRLCANCHELIHLIEQVFVHNNFKYIGLCDCVLQAAAKDETLAKRYAYLKRKIELMLSLVRAMSKAKEASSPVEITVEDEDHSYVIRGGVA